MLGGSYQKVFAANHEPDTHVHHLIARSALNRYRDYLRTQHIQPPTYLADDTQSWAPAIRMSAEDHKRTPSYCKGRNKNKAIRYIDAQTEMLKEGNLKGCFDLEVQNIKRLFGDTYDTHLSQAEAYLTKFLEENPLPTFNTPNIIEELSRIRIELNTLLDRVEKLLKDEKDEGQR